MATIDTTGDLIADLGDEVKSRSASAAAEKLERHNGAAIATALSRLSPAFVQDILEAFREHGIVIPYPQRVLRLLQDAAC